MKKITLSDGRELVEREDGSFQPVTASPGGCACDKPKVEEPVTAMASEEEFAALQGEVASLAARLDAIEAEFAGASMEAIA